MFWLGLAAGIISCAAFYLLMYFMGLVLIKNPNSPILDGISTRVPMMSKNGHKRVPRVLTDKMAYLKEIQEEGENRV